VARAAAEGGRRSATGVDRWPQAGRAQGVPRRGGGALAAVALLLAALVQARAPPPPPLPPQLLYAELFGAVQRAAIFPDSKVFADAVPRDTPAHILARYRREQPRTPEALRQFVAEHFTLPQAVQAAPSPPQQVPVAEHIDRLWDQLTRSTPRVAAYDSLLPLPRPYVVPGGRFREIYYWDSYFTMLGLRESGRSDLVQDMVSDFAWLIDTYGHVPNGTRTYYLSRSQPPLFFAMVQLLNPAHPEVPLGRYLRQLQREHAFWMSGARGLAPGQAARRVVRLADGSLLNRYWDDAPLPRDESYREDTALAAGAASAPQLYRDIRAAAESGWDFGSRWFADQRQRARIDTTRIVPVDLNSLLFGLEQAIARGCSQRGDRACAQRYAQLAAARQAAVDRYLWDAQQDAYRDYDWQQAQRRGTFTAAALFPLFVGLAAPAQADGVARALRQGLLAPGGLVTTTLRTGEQWDAPNGWAPLQWIAIAGLRTYHQEPLAEVIACRWMAIVEQVYAASGKLVEKYDVLDAPRGGGGGEYPLQDGFGWTNGVLRKLLVLYPKYHDLRDAGSCPAPPH
jgi:alpha,alpha-trehalase